MGRHGLESLLALALVSAQPAHAEEPGETSTPRRTVVAGQRYKKGGLHRFLLGAEYRDLWTMPVSLEVLDLDQFAGGLKAVGVLGHGQTQALALDGVDGNSYTFRPILKDPSGLLPVELRETLARSILGDQMASGHPASQVIAPGLLEAAGLLHSSPRLVVMPDDSRLAEFRPAFANVVGDIEVWTGSPGFGGTTETLDGEEMWRRMRESAAVRPDSRAYLKARLVDQLMGDWDRHRNQWRWGKLPGRDRWQPIPEDRDQAFARFEGAVIALLRRQLPFLVEFGPDYSSLAGLTFDGWDVDKRILADLEWPTWREVAEELRSELTDDVITSAARRMPPEYFASDGARLVSALRARRDSLLEQAGRFYRYISRDVDVFGSDEPERIEARRFDDGDLEVSIRSLGAGAAHTPPYFHRRFDGSVTHEVRLYLYGGKDEVVVTGARHGGVLLRVIGGDGGDRLDDARGGGTRFSASAPDASVEPGPETHWDRRPYTVPPANRSGAWIPARDWGRRTGPLFLASYGSDYGVLIGGSLRTTGYGFRKDPWSDQQGLRLVYSTKQKGARGTYLGEFRFENSPVRFDLFALGSGIEVSRFYGLGNASTYQGPQDDYKLEQDRLHLEPALVLTARPRLEISLGAVVKYDKTEPRGNPALGALPFYGEGAFTQVGLTTRFRLGDLTRVGLPRRGFFATGGAAFYPALADVTKPFGEVHAQAKAFLAAPGERGVTLALKAGGQRVFGPRPFFESAFIGGRTPFNPLEPGGGSSVRGLPPQRYAGDASLFGGADLYLPLKRASILVPGRMGVLGFVDLGRVFLTGETSHHWHRGYGGGLFFVTPGRHNIVSASVGHSEGNTAFYLRAGFAF